jgi:hypothetical protein
VIVTVTNLTTRILNRPAASYNFPIAGSTAGVYAVSDGALDDALPYPFTKNGTIAASGTKILPVHPRDWRYKCSPAIPTTSGEDWNNLVQRGVVSISSAAETTRRDQEELFLNLV